MVIRFEGPNMVEKRIKFPIDLRDRLKIHCNIEGLVEYVYILKAIEEKLDRDGAE